MFLLPLVDAKMFCSISSMLRIYFFTLKRVKDSIQVTLICNIF